MSAQLSSCNTCNHYNKYQAPFIVNELIHHLSSPLATSFATHNIEFKIYAHNNAIISISKQNLYICA